MPTPSLPPRRDGEAREECRRSFAWCPFPSSRTLTSLAKVVVYYAAATRADLGLGLPVLSTAGARICESNNSELLITPSAISSGLNLSSIFDCEDGLFTVSWIGAVAVTDSIRIGRGTSVTISGSYSSNSSNNGSVTTSSSSDSESSLEAGAIEPAVVAKTAFGPIFVVEHGGLTLNDIVVRGGNASSLVESEKTSGGGIYADNATLAIKRCMFEDTVAELGGAIRASDSRVDVQDTVFRRCSAGFKAVADVEDAIGAGGGIEVESTDILIKSCRFEDCYAGAKGGALLLEEGSATVLNSTFYNNSVGSSLDTDAVGYGGALVLVGCQRGFEGVGPCGVNDSTFILNHAADASGTVQIGNNGNPSRVEFHDCVIVNSTAGDSSGDGDHGEGGAFGVAAGNTLVLVNTAVRGCSAAKKAGAITLSSDDGFGGTVILRNSTFKDNQAHHDGGGVIYSNEDSKVEVVGDDNWFENNKCKTDGAVFGATSNTEIVIHGGTFIDNFSYQNGGVLHSKGHLLVKGGHFRGNMAEDRGGVFFSAGGGNFTVKNGTFRGNDGGNDGGVVFVSNESELFVEGGIFVSNRADEGGALSVEEDTRLEISSGTFESNKAHHGGFLYKEGNGPASCKGSAIVGHQARAGGAIYAEGGNLHWECDLSNNVAFIGSAIYAVNGTDMTMQGATLYDNGNSRSIAVLLMASTLRTYQVKYQRTTNSTSGTAVQIDADSTYEAEFTSFSGFDGEAVVFNEGNITLDNPNFRGSSAPILVQAEPSSLTTIRNSVLGDMNFEQAVASANGPLTADNLTNADFTCDSGGADGNTAPSLCSEGSACSVGDVGVYCQCYSGVSGAETCLDGDAGRLLLSEVSSPGVTYRDHMLVGTLSLALPYERGQRTSTGTSHGSNGTGVLWRISALSPDIPTPWTILPTTGLLLPGQSINVWVANSPGDDFDGEAKTTFRVYGISISADRESSKWVSFAEVDMDVTYFRCPTGMFWSAMSSDCDLCTSVHNNGDTGLNCSAPGVSTETLPLHAGFWRATLNDTFIRECFNKDACEGGSNVSHVNEYCSHGYTGPYCAVCSPNFGRGAGNECHECTSHFRGFMYFLLALATIAIFFLMIVLAIYLVGGQRAVRSTKQRTREILKTVGRGKDFAHRGGVDNYSVTARCAAGDSDSSHPRREERAFWEEDMVENLSAAKRCIGNERNGGTAIPSHRVEPVNEDRGNRGWRAPPMTAPTNVVTRGAQREGLRSSQQNHMKQSRSGRALGGRGIEMNNTPSIPWGASTTSSEEKDELDDGEDRMPRNGEGPRGGEKRADVADRINDLWSKLPLSKLKIVVVVWQIMGAFSEITQAPLPPIYRKFLSIIGIFTFDLGHIFSAGCIYTRINFYDKLKVVTIGPAVVLCLLGVTFCVGRRHRRRQQRRIYYRTSGMLSPSRERRCPASRGSLGFPRGSNFFANMSSHQRSCRKHRWKEEETSQETDSTSHLFTHRNAGDREDKTTQPAPTTVAGHRGGVPGTVRSPSSPGRGAGKSMTSGSSLEQNRLFSRHTTMALIVLYLIYSQVSTVVLQTFACQDVSEVGKSYLRADFSLECNTPTHRAYKLYAGFCILIYPLGIPAAFCYFLVRQRSKINPRVEKAGNVGNEHVLREKIEQRQSDETVAPTAFLWGAYHPSRYYYEVCECIRRLMLTGLLVFTLSGSPGQLGMSCIFAFLSLQLFEALRPHVERVDIQLYRTGCWVIFFSNFLALVIKVGIADANSRSSAIFSVMLILVNVLLFLSIWCNTWASIGVLFSSRHIQEALLGFELYQGRVRRAPGGSKNGDKDDTDSSEDGEKPAAPALETECSTETLV